VSPMPSNLEWKGRLGLGLPDRKIYSLPSWGDILGPPWTREAADSGIFRSFPETETLPPGRVSKR
jgi:hypothetical protein